MLLKVTMFGIWTCNGYATDKGCCGPFETRNEVQSAEPNVITDSQSRAAQSNCAGCRGNDTRLEPSFPAPRARSDWVRNYRFWGTALVEWCGPDRGFNR